ncbi:MAG TPA: AsmA-like C-terminal region-containing protein, partial [Gammaproteobacteria bacterium]|nr:AsmA-like C-terminal region-containing protein [Gammaproteobacteria bacterium]
DGTTNLITGDTEIRGFSQTPIIKANLLGNALQFGKIKIDKIKTAIAAQEGIITFAPIDIHIAKSQQNATLKLDMRGNTPKIYLTQEAHDFEINDLLTLFDKKDKLSGKTRITMNLSATGTDLQALQNSLSGKAAIEINNGKFHGIDLMNLLKNTQSSIHGLIDALTHKLSIDSLSVIKSELAKWKTDPNSSAFTPFNSLKATATISNGVIQNPDLAIDQTDYAINGAGTINLRANNVRYQTTLQLKNNPYPASDKAGTFLFQTPLHIQIQGTLDDPKIQPDLSRYTNSALEFAQKELVKKVINKTVEKALDKVKGNGAVQDTLHKALGNILNTRQ